MHKHKYINAAMLLLIIIGLAMIPLTNGWLFDGYEDPEFEANAISSYFELGSGTADDPYIISNAYHFYNMSWLLNLGKLDPEHQHFELKAGIGEIDIAGQLDGTMGRSGAIPPIGTSSQPFTGSFNGNGVVIKNLWVSTDPTDWYEQPGQYDDFNIGTDVGLFGNVGYGANISNFYLENIEVTNTISGESAENPVNLGIIVGYADGDISNIGVKNAKLSFNDQEVKNISSRFSLVGDISNLTYWEGLPSMKNEDGTGGGDLIITPAKLHNGSLSSGTQFIDGAMANSAYFVAKMTVGSSNPPPSKNSTYIFTSATIDFPEGNTKTVTYTADKDTTQNITDWDNVETEFNALYNSSIKVIMPGGAPGFSSAAANGLPANTIWFEPQNTGTCTIAFSRQDNSDDNNMSIYRFSRKADGTIDTSTMKEIILKLRKTNGLGTGAIIYFSLEIHEDDLGYEFAIGRSSISENSSKQSAGFVFLKLAGTDTHGGNIITPDVPNVRMLKKLAFVYDINLSTDQIEMHKSVIDIDGTVNEKVGSAVYYNANETVVLYHNATSLHVIDIAYITPAQSLPEAYSEATFPKREDTLPESPTQ